MAWWGKVLGGTFGFAFGGPLGAMLGAAIGHSFDKGLAGLEALDPSELGGASHQHTERIQAAFFTATFSVMGHIAKADGRVTENEIQVAQRTMGQMQLSAEQQHAAQNLFREGKQAQFDRRAVLQQFRRECGRRRNLFIIFMEIQIATALADGELHRDELSLLRDIADFLGIKRGEFEGLLARATAQQGFAGHAGAHESVSASQRLAQAYQILGVSAQDDDATIKKAYRRLLSQHHPDKLVSKGLPEEMMKVATEKTREIKQAFDYIKQHRKTQ